MKISKTKLLFIATLFFLAIPLVLSGVASAGYQGDGALWDSGTHGWKIPPIETGVNGCLADTTKTSRPDCETVRYPSYTDGTACSASAEFVAGKAQWSSVCSRGGTAVNLKGGDRNALECNKLGGTYQRECNGKWTDVKDSAGGTTLYDCLRCHNTTYQRNSYKARWKDSYLKTGHKNMLRKVTAAQPWAGPDGVDYHSLEAGTTIDWTNAKISGTSFTGARDLYYIYGDWMAPAANGVYDTTSGGTAGYAKYSCASCHTTGYIGTNFVTTKQPYMTYPSINSGITGSWDKDGIVCSRCHNAVTEGTSYTDPHRTGLKTGSNLSFTTHETDNMADGAERTAICFECHNSTQTQMDPAGQLKTAASGAGFSGHILGNQFLNSAHGKFSGSSEFIGTQANYASAFPGAANAGQCYIIKTGITSTSGQLVEALTETDCAQLVAEYAATSYTWTPATGGSCSTCHDVHQSIVPEVGAAEPLRRECTTCHSKAINHPNGAGSPQGLAGGANAEACAICHMALESPEGSTHLPIHLWRINTDTSYKTFPTSTEWSAGTKIAFTAPDGAYANAVWLDLQLACGQCHISATKAAEGVLQITDLSVLQAQALIIHQGNAGQPVLPPGAGVVNIEPIALNTTTGDTSTAFAAGEPAGGSSVDGLGVCVLIDWGDGTALQAVGAGTTATHTYANPGTYKIRKTVQDGECNIAGNNIEPGTSFGFSSYVEAEVLVSNLATGGFGSINVAAQACVGGAPIQNVNTYFVSGHYSFHGVTDAAGAAVVPTVVNTMPVGSYQMTAFGPQGLICYSDPACTTLVNLVGPPVGTAVSTGSSVTVYCQ